MISELFEEIITEVPELPETNLKNELDDAWDFTIWDSIKKYKKQVITGDQQIILFKRLKKHYLGK